VLRSIDRVLAPITWLAAAFTALALLAGPALIGAKADKPAGAAVTAGSGTADGKKVFTSNCGGCHTLARAGTNGSVGPNLDDLKPAAALVKTTVKNGAGTMPAFGDKLSAAEIDAVAAFVAGEKEAAAKPAPTTTPTTVTPAAKASTVHTDRGPDGITFSGGRVWVANATAGTLQRFDASTGRPQGKPLAVGRQPDNPVVAGGAVWVALSSERAVARVQGRRVTKIPVGRSPQDLAVAGGKLWVTNGGDATVTRIDLSSGQVSGAPIPVGKRPLGIAASGNTVWVTSYDEGTVRRLDAASGTQRGAPIRVGPHPRAIAAGGGTAWVTSRDDGTVKRLRDGKTVKVGGDPRDLVVADGSVWVASARDGTVTHIDADSAKAADPIEAGEDPIGIAVGGGSVWTTNFRADTVTRTPA
jgi:DNA-binding beta-propeller fold protein YncE